MIVGNRLEFCEIDFGIAKAGLVSVQVNALLGSQDVGAILRDSGAVAVVFDSALADVVDAARREAPARSFIAIGPEVPSWAQPYSSYINKASTREPAVRVTGEMLYRLAYTSGTTGQPKGVMLSHNAVLAVSYNLLLEFGPVRAGDRLLHVQPLSHGTGMFVLPWFLRGATSVIHKRFDAERVLESRRRERIDVIKLVPTMLVRMLDQGEERLEALRGVRSIIYGASPMPVDRLRQCVGRLGPVFAQLYGQSESPMTITVLPQEDHVLDGGVLETRLASAGRPWTNVGVRVVDEEGRDVPNGEPGEVIVQGPQNMDGYWHRPDDTARTLVDGWVHTRDIGTFDEAGYLFLFDRKEDMIITGGLNVYPRQVEEVLYQNPSVREATVVGVEDDKWGEKIVAVVSLKSNHTITGGELVAFCRERLSGYKTPKSIVFVDQMPKSAFGKISRKHVKQVISSHAAD